MVKKRYASTIFEPQIYLFLDHFCMYEILGEFWLGLTLPETQKSAQLKTKNSANSPPNSENAKF